MNTQAANNPVTSKDGKYDSRGVRIRYAIAVAVKRVDPKHRMI